MGNWAKKSLLYDINLKIAPNKTGKRGFTRNNSDIVIIIQINIHLERLIKKLHRMIPINSRYIKTHWWNPGNGLCCPGQLVNLRFTWNERDKKIKLRNDSKIWLECREETECRIVWKYRYELFWKQRRVWIACHLLVFT